MAEQDRARQESLSTKEIGERVVALMNAVSQKLVVDPSIGLQLARNYLGGMVPHKNSQPLQIERDGATIEFDYQAYDFKLAPGRVGEPDLYVPNNRSMNFGFDGTQDKLSFSRIISIGSNWSKRITGHIEAKVDGEVHVNSPSAFAHAYRMLSPILTP